MSDAFAETLHLSVHVSTGHRRLVLTVHVLAALVTMALATYRPGFWLLLPLVMIAGLLSWRRALLRDDASIIRLRWHGDDSWAWQSRDGRWHTGMRRDSFVFGTLLVILTLRSQTTRWRSARVVLFRDSLEADSHRRLRARLTIAPAPETADE